MAGPSAFRERPVPANKVTVVPFSKPQFIDQVARASRGASVGAPAAEQTVYIAEFLRRLGTVSLVVESHYVDRHFIEEHALYYSRCLVQPTNVCVRIHAFSCGLDHAGLSKLVREAAQGTGSSAAVQQKLETSYLGFIVIRPLPSVPIGRTVLRPPSDGATLYTLIRYTVHLLGLELRITGLAFQQQDRAVGACATTAIWVALQRLIRHDGGRSPTPAAVTQAAVRHFLPEGRPFPSGGLAAEQVSEALRNFDFGPEVFGGAPTRFCRLLMGIYLRSGIPVVLGVDVGHRDVQHAIVALGCRVARAGSSRRRTVSGERVRLINLDFDELIFHDDRIGPYLNARLVSGPRSLALKLSGKGVGRQTLRILMAFAPLYPKIRTSAEQLVTRAFNMLPLMEYLIGGKRGLEVEMFFDRAGSYQESLFAKRLSPQRVARFQQTAALSRYVGVIRWSSKGQPLMDTLWDTTDKMRDTVLAEQLLGAVALSRVAEPHTDHLGHLLATTVG